MGRPLSVLLVPLWFAGSLAGQADARRLITLDDLHRLKTVSDPQLSPDGAWVAYTVSQVDTSADKQVSDIWMTSWQGTTSLRLTWTASESEHAPRWSPDGRYLAFLSSRGDRDEADQLWLLDRRGGEADRITDARGGISDFVWSPDGTRVVLVIEDSDTVEVSDIAGTQAQSGADTVRGAGGPARKTPPPIVVDRFYFKEDYTGYLRRKRKHLYLLRLADRKLEPLTSGAYDELLPAWSPDGLRLVFASKRAGPDPDRHANWDLWVVRAEPLGEPLQLTTFSGPDAHPDWESRPAWSPDGRTIAYLQGGPDSLIYYAGPRLAVVPADGQGAARVLTAGLDRHVREPRWSEDGQLLYCLIEDDRVVHLARIPLTGGSIERVLDGRLVVAGFSLRGDRMAALVDAPDRPAEIFAVEAGARRQLSHQNDSLLAGIRLVAVEEITARSRDGTWVQGFLVRPAGTTAGTRVPAILNIHGGPVSQFQNEFDFYWQLLAANGYAVVGMNPRGSSGRGQQFALAIWADWGNKDAQDVLAGVDYAVKLGVADPDRLGVGGWSYGGILTNHVIAQDSRFMAATSGSSISNILAGYGTDQYVREYEAELGAPWANTRTWLRLSSPFLKANRIRTPTLFLCGARDLNVPLLNSEQMYQALRSLGVPTRLIVYPDTWHGVDTPSYARHRLEQYLEWFGSYLGR